MKAIQQIQTYTPRLVDDIIICPVGLITELTNPWLLWQRQRYCKNDNKVEVFKLQIEADDKTGDLFRPNLGLP